MRNDFGFVVAILAAELTSAAQAVDDTSPSLSLDAKGYFRIDTGLSFLAYNNVDIPNNLSSDRFSLHSLLGSGSRQFGRFSYDKPILGGRQGYRFVVSLIDETGDGVLALPVRIGAKILQPGVKTRAFYRFNGYRATYWWRMHQDQNNLVRIGATLNIRDATIDVRQPGAQAYESNIGPVPLLYFQIDHRVSDRVKATFETDAFAVPGGRAIDANLRLAYSLNPVTDLSLGVRAFDGLGDEKGPVFNSIRYYYTTIGIGYKF